METAHTTSPEDKHTTSPEDKQSGGKGMQSPKNNTTTTQHPNHTPMTQGPIAESKSPVPESQMYRQGTNHFKAARLHEAIFMLASTQMLLNKASQSELDPPPELVDIITNSKLPLFQVEGKKQMHICSPEELTPLAQLMEKTDNQIRKKLETIIKIINIRNEHANSKNNSETAQAS